MRALNFQTWATNLTSVKPLSPGFSQHPWLMAVDLLHAFPLGLCLQLCPGCGLGRVVNGVSDASGGPGSLVHSHCLSFGEHSARLSPSTYVLDTGLESVSSPCTMK